MNDSLSAWKKPPEVVNIAAGEVHLWRVRLVCADDEIPALRAVLSADEVTRADRFVRAEHGLRFTVAHARLRQILAKYSEDKPEELSFEVNEQGKPRLSGHGSRDYVQFNLSHSGDWAIVGVVGGGAVGVDIEHRRATVEMEQIARRHFSPDEVERLLGLPDDDREQAFFDCWCRKEAYVKARGEGIAMGLKHFSVSFESGEDPRLLQSEEEGEAARWTFFAPELADGYSAVCVVEGAASVVQQWDIPG